MISHKRLTDVLFYVQKLIDTSVALGAAVAVSPLALHIVDPPGSISETFQTPEAAYLWGLGSFIAYTCVVIGSLLKGRTGPTGIPAKQTYLYFEFPGLITASFLTTAYGLAALIVFGTTSFVAAGFSIAIGIYFLGRWFRTLYTLKAAKSNVQQSLRS